MEWAAANSSLTEIEVWHTDARTRPDSVDYISLKGDANQNEDLFR
jgi:hypothetical protein